MKIEVAYALPDQQKLLKLEIKEGETLENALDKSGILTLFPEIDLKVNKVGIFGKIASLTALLREGDRIEIYRPLVADPKKARHKRIQSKRES